MKSKREIIGLFLVCVIMAAIGVAFHMEENQGYSVQLIFVAFVTLLVFLVKITQSGMKRVLKSIFICLAALAETLWLNWVGVSLTLWSALLFTGAVCAVWFLIHAVPDLVHQRRVLLRWNTAYAAKNAGGSAEEYLQEIEQCEAELQNHTTISLTYGGIPFKEYLSVHKIYLLKEMGRKQECLALLQNIQPKIKNPDVRKALSEMETELEKP